MGGKIMKNRAGWQIIGILFLMSQCMSANAVAQGSKISVLNPLGQPGPTPLIPMAPRLDTLDGKTVYLVDVGWGKPSGVRLLEQISEWFAKNMPKVKTVIKEKAGGYTENDAALWTEVKQKGNAMIMAIGH
jgi:hypothetical protein